MEPPSRKRPRSSSATATEEAAHYREEGRAGSSTSLELQQQADLQQQQQNDRAREDQAALEFSIGAPDNYAYVREALEAAAAADERQKAENRHGQGNQDHTVTAEGALANLADLIAPHPPAEYWDASALQLETFPELLDRREEILRLLSEQGNVPHLQEASHAAVQHLLSVKQPSWALLLTRSFSLYSIWCGQRGIPVFPIVGPKVALYLVRSDNVEIDAHGNIVDVSDGRIDHGEGVSGEDVTGQHADDRLPKGNEEETLNLVEHQDVEEDKPDLNVNSDSALTLRLDPTLGQDPTSYTSHDHAQAQAIASANHVHDQTHPTLNAPSKTGSKVGAKPKKVLRKKTLEQYLNRLTTLRTPTISMWKNRIGSEGEGDAGLGVHPIIRDMMRRIDGDAQNTNGRDGVMGNGQKRSRGSSKVKGKTAAGAAAAAAAAAQKFLLGSEDSPDGLHNHQQLHHHHHHQEASSLAASMGVDLEVDENASENASRAVTSVIRHFTVASSAGGSFNVRVDPNVPGAEAFINSGLYNALTAADLVDTTPNHIPTSTSTSSHITNIGLETDSAMILDEDRLNNDHGGSNDLASSITKHRDLPGEIFMLSPQTYLMAMHYVKSLVEIDGIDKGRLGEIARSVEASVLADQSHQQQQHLQQQQQQQQHLQQEQDQEPTEVSMTGHVTNVNDVEADYDGRLSIDPILRT